MFYLDRWTILKSSPTMVLKREAPTTESRQESLTSTPLTSSISPAIMEDLSIFDDSPPTNTVDELFPVLASIMPNPSAPCSPPPAWCDASATQTQTTPSTKPPPQNSPLLGLSTPSQHARWNHGDFGPSFNTPSVPLGCHTTAPVLSTTSTRPIHQQANWAHRVPIPSHKSTPRPTNWNTFRTCPHIPARKMRHLRASCPPLDIDLGDDAPPNENPNLYYLVIKNLHNAYIETRHLIAMMANAIAPIQDISFAVDAEGRVRCFLGFQSIQASLDVGTRFPKTVAERPVSIACAASRFLLDRD